VYLDWASRALQPLPNNFVHAEWITLHISRAAGQQGERDAVAIAEIYAL
jgi:hypothetical protein